MSTDCFHLPGAWSLIPPLCLIKHKHTHEHVHTQVHTQAQQGRLSVNHTIVLCTHLAYILNTSSLESK